MSPTATIQLTTMELVTGNPKTLAISTGFCEGPCSVSSGVTDTTLACTAAPADVAELSPACAALALSAPRQITAAAKIDISLVLKSSTWPVFLAGCRNRRCARKLFPSNRFVSNDHKVESMVKEPIQRVQQLNTAPEVN